MTTQEQLKIYAAYLPYKVAFSDLTCDMPNKLILDTENFSGVLEDATHLNTIRLHLYDLSYLTKEIEHEGRKFIPMHVLKNGGTDLNEYRFLEWKGYSAIDNEQHETCYCPKTMSFYQFYMGDSRMCTDQYNKFQLLLSWHFNVFNLPAGDFIDKATFKNRKQ
ncbi:hypothetical protein [uncultured Chryseobacterium sp.]|uniref:hypothetical protein n=1 Tax=uncultured Chryseobacterium sp. TaxID=259322 RepID=UPI0025ED1DED|nr:hypothetical protein [uncultured Chryseobacterium sp.]